GRASRGSAECYTHSAHVRGSRWLLLLHSPGRCRTAPSRRSPGRAAERSGNTGATLQLPRAANQPINRPPCTQRHPATATNPSPPIRERAGCQPGAGWTLLLPPLSVKCSWTNRQLVYTENDAASVRGYRKCALRSQTEANNEEEEDCCGDAFRGSLESLPEGFQLICKPSALAKWLLKAFQQSQLESRDYWLSNWPHLQTIIQHLLPADRTLELARDHLQLTDGGLVALDWVVGPRPVAKPRRGTNAINNPSLLLIIPNSFGKLTRNIQQLCLLALEQGNYPVIFNRRGQNDCPLTNLTFQPFGEPADLKEAVNYVLFRHPSSRIFAVSEGLGSELLLSYLGECGSSSYITAACCISPVFRFQEWFETGLSWPYERILLLYQKMILSRYSTAIAEVMPAEKIFASRSLRELHENLFCQCKTETSWDCYWESNDPLRDVDEVAIPVLCICSKDDPIRGRPETTLPMELFRTNPYFFLLLTHQGGHCGFLTGSQVAWSHEVTLNYFRSITEFFVAEEKSRLLVRRRGSNMINRRRRGTLQKRERPSYADLEEIFSWKRSYTR
uniref:Protein ABHD15 n=1 Tax=Leptobrachium leishanense TaxID=445787 RepID=A0A8C5PP84_9ANUR